MLFRSYLAEYDIESELAFIDKRRPKGTHNVAVASEVVGEVEGRHCIVVDDMIDTAGTVAAAANLLKERGAASVRILATHGLLSGPAVDRLRDAPVEEVVVIGVPDSYRGQSAKAFVKLKAGAAPFALEELRTFLADKIGKHEMPTMLEIREALPRTAVGKIGRAHV